MEVSVPVILAGSNITMFPESQRHQRTTARFANIEYGHEHKRLHKIKAISLQNVIGKFDIDGVTSASQYQSQSGRFSLGVGREECCSTSMCFSLAREKHWVHATFSCWWTKSGKVIQYFIVDGWECYIIKHKAYAMQLCHEMSVLLVQSQRAQKV